MTDTVDIHGEEYTLVAARLRMFNEDHPKWAIQTTVSVTDPLNPHLVRVSAQIRNKKGKLVRTGHADEDREAGGMLANMPVNRFVAPMRCRTLYSNKLLKNYTKALQPPL